MKRWAVVILLGTIFFSFSSLYAKETAHELVSRIVDKYSHAGSVVAKFAEKDENGSVEGILSFRGTDKFKLELSDKMIVCNGKLIWIYTPSQKRVTIDAYHRSKNSLTPEFFIANVPENARASILAPENGKYMRLQLEPPDENAWGFIKRIVLDVEEANATIHRVEITDEDGVQRAISIRSLKFDAKLPESEFEFVPPKDATVVDLR